MSNWSAGEPGNVDVTADGHPPEAVREFVISVRLPGKSREDYIDEANAAIADLLDQRETQRTEIARLRAAMARLREGLGLLNSLGIAGPNIRHVVQTEPDPKWDREELDVWEMTKAQTWCVCGREWPCEALRLDTLLCAALARLEGAS